MNSLNKVGGKWGPQLSPILILTPFKRRLSGDMSFYDAAVYGFPIVNDTFAWC